MTLRPLRTAPDPDHEPAVVEYLDAKRVRVSHPLDPQHENVERTVARLRARGYVVVEP